MTVLEIKNLIMFQTNNDADDLGDFLPHITSYINDGYDRAAMAYAKEHVSTESDTYLPLSHDKSSPEVPDWMHRAIADWATWLIYRNGNTNKQNRGFPFRNAAEEVFARASSMGGGKYFKNIPR